MTGEKVLIVGDSLNVATGFGVNGGNISWCLAKDYDVHYLGLHSQVGSDVKLDIEGEVRLIKQHPNLPADGKEFDYGTKSLPALIDKLDPELLLTINDIQMVNHIPEMMCPKGINLPIIDLPSKTFISEEAMKRKIDGEIAKFKEEYPRDMKWIAYCPQDGDPPMGQWVNVYRSADKVIAMSKYGQSVFKKYYQMDVPYIWHGADSQVFFPNSNKPKSLEDKFILGDINRNQPRKQPLKIIEAFTAFAKDKNDVYLHMQKNWNDPFGWPIKYFTDMYGITGKCIQPAPNNMSKESVAKSYNTWDVNLMVTGGEGFGLAFAESMMCGVPNIANDYTTSKELIDDMWPRPRGILTECDLHWQSMKVSAVRRALVKVDSLTDAMNTYYNDRDKLAKHGENAAKFAQKHLTLKKQQLQWVDAVKDVLS